MVAALDDELSIRGQQVTGLGDALVAGKDIAGQDQRLGPGPAFGQAPRDQ
jgi:hypothetical protein